MFAFAFAADGENTVRKLELGFFKEGDGENVAIGAGDGIQAQRRKNVPGGEGAAVVVARKTIGARAIQILLDPTNPVNRTIRIPQSAKR